jgi:CPA1 family monovalent cation:H+ antiporter
VKDNEEEQQLSIRLRLANAVLDYITAEYGREAESIEAFSRLRARYERMIEITSSKLEKEQAGTAVVPTFLPRYRQLLLELVKIQRQEVSHMRRDNQYEEELLRNKEYELDLEEARFRR